MLFVNHKKSGLPLSHIAKWRRWNISHVTLSLGQVINAGRWLKDFLMLPSSTARKTPRQIFSVGAFTVSSAVTGPWWNVETICFSIWISVYLIVCACNIYFIKQWEINTLKLLTGLSSWLLNMAHMTVFSRQNQA